MTEECLLNLQVLREFDRFLYGNWEKEIVLVELLRVFDEALGCSRAGAYLWEKGRFELKAKNGEPLDSPNLLEQCRELILHADGQDSLDKPFLLNSGSLFMLPLAGEREIFGIVLYELPGPSRRQVEMVSMLGFLASAALRNARRNGEKKIMDEVVSTFTSGLDIHVYYPHFAEQLRQITPFDILTITIPDPFQTGELIVYGVGSKNLLKTTRIPYGGSAPAWVISTGRAIIEDDLRENRNFTEDEQLLSYGIRCALRVPLVSKRRVIGTLNIGSKNPCLYKQREIDLFTEVADRIGPAVENALVYETVNQRLSQALIQLENTFSATLNALTTLLDQRDVGTKGHSLRVIRYATAIAEKLGLQGKELEDVRLGSLLHDIGKIGIPDSILFKPGKLDNEELNVMKTHPELGAEMVSKVEFLKPALPVVLHHHECFDGSGYPAGLRGDGIPLGARIFAVADAFDAMTSKRTYRNALPVRQVIQELKKYKGSQFCPDCFNAFLKIPAKELRSIYDECQAEVNFQSPYLVGRELINAEMAKALSKRK